MNCANCRTEVAVGAKFCPKCGTPLGVAPVGGQTMATAAPSVPLARTKSIPPELIAGRYRIFEKLGEGAMGAVYRGEQISLKRAVAVKLLKSALSSDKTLVRRFNAEAEAVAKLSHPNTVNIHDFGQEKDGSLFIVMELVEGRTLRAAIEQEAPFSPQRTLFIASQIAASLGDAHARSIIHRDLKPDNVMLQTRGRVRDIVRVLDFGIAKLRDDSRATMAAMTQAGDMLGTPQYMAPEQVLGDAIDGRVDIYALGCIIYEMVTARRVFDAQSVTEILTKHLSENVIAPSQRRPDLNIPPEIDRLVLTATMKQAAARPASMEAYGEQIASVLSQMPREPGHSSSEALPIAYAPLSGVVPALATPPAGMPNVSPMQTPPAGTPRAHSPSSGLPQIAPTVAVTPPGGLPPANRAHTPSSQALPPAQRAHTPSAQALPMYGRLPSGHVAAQQTPPAGLPPAPSGPSSALSSSSTDVGHHRASRAPWLALLGVVVVAAIGGGVYLATKEKARTKVATNNEPRGSATTPPIDAAANASEGSATTRTAGALHDLPTFPATGSASSPTTGPGTKTGSAASGSAAAGSGAGSDAPEQPGALSGTTMNAASGFKLIVPPGFKTQRQGNNLIAQTKGYTIVIGPITSKQLDPEAAAKEYAEGTGLTLDGVIDLDLDGTTRPGAAFHGTLYGDEVAQSIVNYIGPGYRVAVSLTMPFANRNHPQVRDFANELFAKRVIVPSPY